MDTGTTTDFLSGVIEGFYGPPWSRAERFELLELMREGGLNTYVYAPKDDLKHRAVWRESYTAEVAEELGRQIAACESRHIRFVYALSPGLDIRYRSTDDRQQLKRRFEQMTGLGCRHFALLFDDIPDRIEPADLGRWGSLAAAQADVANELWQWARERSSGGRFLFCPTPYCGRMAGRGLGGAGYLTTIGRELAPEIDVFWTGPEIISQEITLAHVRELQSALRRKPVLWDNLFANDYDGRRFFCGPYSGRPPELRGETRGILLNPNTEHPLNFVPLRTFAQFLRVDGDWNPRSAYLSAMEEWLGRFGTVGAPLTRDDLVLLGDCYYLPHEEGPEADALLGVARELVASDPRQWRGQPGDFRQRAARLRDLCARLTELRDRPLFHALSRRIWDLREELDLLLGWVRLKEQSRSLDEDCRSDFHLPGTFRGGTIARLQRLLEQRTDGTFVPRHWEDDAAGAARGALRSKLPAR